MLCVHARDGVNRTTQEHLAAALALDIPVFAVVTQADTAAPEALQATVRATRTLLATAADTAAFARPSPAGHSTDDASDADPPPAAPDSRARGDFMFAIDDDQVRRPASRTPARGPHVFALPRAVPHAFSWHRPAGTAGAVSSSGCVHMNTYACHMSTRAVGADLCVECMQAAERRLERRVPLVATEAKAAAVAQLMGIIQQHHHPLQCRSYIVPCFITSSTTGSVRPLSHSLSVRPHPQRPRLATFTNASPIFCTQTLAALLPRCHPYPGVRGQRSISRAWRRQCAPACLRAPGMHGVCCAGRDAAAPIPIRPAAGAAAQAAGRRAPPPPCP